MTIQDVIATKRDGQKHTREELEWLARAAAGHEEAADYQLSAWLMAAYVNGLDNEETLGLTLAMAHSGKRLDLSKLPKPWLDKHSTGGVGDKTTLVVLPILAASGITMVKMSGRGLGITGGTIDKLESIPGFRTNLSIDELLAQAQRIGLAITGQSADLAPADKTLYALRDTTGTVGSMPLIVSSILSKKIAAGADHLVLDVKCGSGGFMPDLDSATSLGLKLKTTAEAAGLRTSVAITDMSQPLGSCVGNAIEVLEADETLRGRKGRFRDLCIELSAEALLNTGKAANLEEGKGQATAILDSGRAWDKWRLLIQAQGGPDIDQNPLSNLLPLAPVTEICWHGEDGWVERIDAGLIGAVVAEMGGGRHSKGDEIDHSVGIESLVTVGDRIEKDQTIFKVYGNETPLTILSNALFASPSQIPSIPPVLSRV